MNMKEALSKEFTLEEKQEMASWIINKKLEKILSKEVLIARWLVRNKVDITLKVWDCKDKDVDIRTFLWLYGFTEIDVSSDFPSYRESYEWTTTIKFNV